MSQKSIRNYTNDRVNHILKTFIITIIYIQGGRRKVEHVKQRYETYLKRKKIKLLEAKKQSIRLKKHTK